MALSVNKMGQFDNEHISIQLKVPRGIMADIKPREAFAETFRAFARLVELYPEIYEIIKREFPKALEMLNAMEARR